MDKSQELFNFVYLSCAMFLANDTHLPIAHEKFAKGEAFFGLLSAPFFRETVP